MTDQAEPEFSEEDKYVLLKWEAEEFGPGDGEPTSYIHPCSCKIFVVPIESEVETEVGYIDADYVDVEGAITEGMGTFNAFDATAQTMAFYEELFDGATDDLLAKVVDAVEPGGPLLGENVLLIHEIYIEPQYRGHWYGLQALHGLIHWKRHGTGLIAIRRIPLQYYPSVTAEEIKKWQLDRYRGGRRGAFAKLQLHFSYLQFVRVRGTDLLVRNPDRPLPNYFDLEKRVPPLERPDPVEEIVPDDEPEPLISALIIPFKRRHPPMAD